MKSYINLTCWILGIISFAVMSTNAMAFDLSSPRATVHSFVGSLNQYNFKQAALCVEGADPDKMSQLSDWEKDLEKVHSTMVVSNLQTKINDKEAIVTATVAMKVGEPQETNSVTHSHLRLRKHSEKWQIIPDDPQTFELVGPQDYLGYTAAFLAHPEAFSEVRAAAEGNSCRGNIRQLTLAMQQFVKDNNGIFTNKASSFTQSLKPYIVRNQVYICPSDKTSYLQPDGVKTSYSFNVKLEDVSLASIKDPSKVVMLYEGKDGKLNFRHNGKASVAFVDGTTKLISEKDAAALRWN